MRCEQKNNTGLQLLQPRSACEDPTNRHREVLFSRVEGSCRRRLIDGAGHRVHYHMRACFVEGFWIKYGPQPQLEDTKFILTGSKIVNLKNIVRAISVERFPVLLQGPTSAGVLSARLTVYFLLFANKNVSR
jgi:hypothetical protein